MQRNRSIPPTQVIPELTYPDIGAAAAWLSNAFGFSERLRIADHRVQLTFGGGAVVLVSGTVESSDLSSHSVMVRVDDVDGHFARAQKAGAKILGVPVTYPYGERQYAAHDLVGHRWVFSQTVADVDPSEWGAMLVKSGSAA